MFCRWKKEPNKNNLNSQTKATAKHDCSADQSQAVSLLSVELFFRSLPPSHSSPEPCGQSLAGSAAAAPGGRRAEHGYPLCLLVPSNAMCPCHLPRCTSLRWYSGCGDPLGPLAASEPVGEVPAGCQVEPREHSKQVQVDTCMPRQDAAHDAGDGVLARSITRSMAAVLGSGPAPGMPMPPMQPGIVKFRISGI